MGEIPITGVKFHCEIKYFDEIFSLIFFPHQEFIFLQKILNPDF